MSDLESHVAAAERALELQRQLLLKLRGELPEAVAAQRTKTASICFDLAEHHKRTRKFERVGHEGVVSHDGLLG